MEPGEQALRDLVGGRGAARAARVPVRSEHGVLHDELLPVVEQLKQRWVQGNAGTRVGEGAGLGLAIVARYAELLGAKFALANAPDGGLRASIVLPAA